MCTALEASISTRFGFNYILIRGATVRLGFAMHFWLPGELYVYKWTPTFVHVKIIILLIPSDHNRCSMAVHVLCILRHV